MRDWNSKHQQIIGDTLSLVAYFYLFGRLYFNVTFALVKIQKMTQNMEIKVLILLPMVMSNDIT